jgi:transposase
MLVDYGLRLDTIVSDIFGKSARDIIEAIANGMPPEEAAQLVSTRLKATPDDIRRALAAELDDDQRCLLRRLLKQVDWFEGQKDDLEFELEAAFAEHSELLDRLETIPGVNRVTAAAVLAEIGTDMSVFGNSERLCKWAGVCPGNNESAGKRKSGKTVAGNKWLRRTLCESAHAATKTTSHFCGVFKRIKARRGFKRAIVAIAHRLLRTVFVLISRKDVYRDRTIDYETLGLMLRLPRWAKVLKQLGYLVRPPKPQASEKPSSA